MNSPLIQRLRGLRARLRRLYLTAGVLRLLVETMLVLVIAYLQDRFLDLPGSVRVIFLLAVVGAFLWRFQKLVLYPLRKRIGVEDLALAVERRHRELDGGLASAVELIGMREKPPADVSPELLDLWLAQMESRGASVRFDDVFEFRYLKVLAGLVGALVLGLTAFCWMESEQTAVFLRRLVGMEVSWPRRTHLAVVIPDDKAHYRVERDASGHPARVIVARGASLPLVAMVTGTVPEEVFLLVRESERAARSEEVRMLPREGEKGVFSYRFRNVVRGLELRPRAGDDPGSGREVVVEVAAPPTVEKLIASITPPAYTGLPAVREERQDFHVPVGTRLDLEVSTSGALAEGSITFHGDPASAQPLVRHPENPTQFLFSFVVEESGTFNLHLTGENGFRNLVALDYRYAAIADRLPSLEILQPATSNLEVTARGVVPFRILADDDYGLTRVGLEMVRFGDAESIQRIELLAVDGRPAKVIGEPLALQHNLDLLSFQINREGRPDALNEGETLVHHVVARDNCEAPGGQAKPNEARTTPRRIDVVSESEKTRKLSDRQLRIKQKVRSAQQTQTETLDELNAYRNVSAEELMAASSRDLSAMEIDQDRISSRTRQVSAELAELVEEYLLNRLDPSPSAERALVRFLELNHISAARIQFDPAPYREMIQGFQAGNFGQLDFLGNLFQMLALAFRASEQESTAAVAAIREARVGSATERRPELLEAAAAQQAAVVQTYDELLKKMEEWEEFQEIVDQWRSLVTSQEELNRRYRQEGN